MGSGAGSGEAGRAVSPGMAPSRAVTFCSLRAQSGCLDLIRTKMPYRRVSPWLKGCDRERQKRGGHTTLQLS